MDGKIYTITKKKQKQNIMKILATQIEKGMTIKVTNLFDMTNNDNKKQGVDFSIESHKFLKSSPTYKVLTVSEVITNGSYRTLRKMVADKYIAITLEGVNGVCEISPKQKVVLMEETNFSSIQEKIDGLESLLSLYDESDYKYIDIEEKIIALQEMLGTNQFKKD